jgi:predicted ATP-binding protein involved in virulence
MYEQVRQALDRLLRPTGCTFSGEMDQGDFLFDCRGVRIPFQRLSDGYRAFIGWVADLLFHMTWNGEGEIAIPDTRGVVLVDEIDLHLHPQWQMQVIKTVATALPRMQFIFTSHSPLIAGSLEWMNIITLKTSRKTNRTVSKRLRQSIHGLDADQVLLTDFFGLKTTRADGKKTKLDNLRKQARSGDREAARKMILAMAQGTEEDEA